jgi:hypothetical protein
MVPAGKRLLVSLIETYVAELDSTLRGPRGVKADIVAEALDGLLEATEAYRDSGLDEDGAQQRAIADFGTVPQIAPGFQVELGLSQGRRTGLLISVAMAAQPVAWHGLQHLMGAQGEASPAYLAVSMVVRYTGIAALVGGLLTALALGIGTRYLRPRSLLTRATGIFAFVVCGVFAVLGVLLTVVSPGTGSLLAWSGLPCTMALLGLPLIGIGVAARECLAAA